ncbi:nucleotide-diphospho-sugar transferase [Dunaliella salina]|uniref:Hexosyltransferase n=1 Tax=Dunaliella salina TaxID=3046 RepID=A0ABQ7GXU5_DUNSA|nr:nucleotide-diphospho-sugar transferase [Dunaliella salina]|eukprot:KAF5839426.1 nucleotide-diphospho-sugar transferase [Dunaliella salina]
MSLAYLLLLLAGLLASVAQRQPTPSDASTDGIQPGHALNKEAYLTFLGPYVMAEGKHDADMVDWYFVSARYLLYRLMKHELTKTKQPRDFLVLITSGISDWKRETLEKDGAKLVEVPPDVLKQLLQPESSWLTSEKRWKYNFAKLHAWNLIQYERIAYIDADVWVRANMDGMFSYVTNFPFAAVRDLEHNIFLGLRTLSEGFNAGLFALQPSQEVFKHMVSLINNVDKYKIHNMEQGFLNYYYGVSWNEIPREYSGNHLGQALELNYSRSAHEKMWTKLGSCGGQGEMALVWLKELLADMPEYQGDARIASAGSNRMRAALARMVHGHLRQVVGRRMGF